MQRFLKTLGKLLGIISVLVAFVVLAIPPSLYFFYRQYIYVDVSAVPKEEGVAMVLGAGLQDNETPSNALQERLDIATTLYKEGKITSILVSGTRDSVFHDEPRAMANALVKAGVPEAAIVQDGGENIRTFDSCYRAKNTLKYEKLLVISQGFHLPRALFLCRTLGLEATGVYAVGGFSTYYSRWYTLREIGAMYRAVWDVIIK